MAADAGILSSPPACVLTGRNNFTKTVGKETGSDL